MNLELLRNSNVDTSGTKLVFQFGKNNPTFLALHLLPEIITDVALRKAAFKTIIETLRFTLAVDLDPKLIIKEELNGQTIDLLKPTSNIPKRKFFVSVIVDGEPLAQNGLYSATLGKEYSFAYLLEENTQYMERILSNCFLFGQTVLSGLIKLTTTEKKAINKTPEQLRKIEERIQKRNAQIAAIKQLREQHTLSNESALLSLLEPVTVPVLQERKMEQAKKNAAIKAYKEERKAAK